MIRRTRCSGSASGRMVAPPGLRIEMFGLWLYDRLSSRSIFAFVGYSRSSSMQLHPCFTRRSGHLVAQCTHPPFARSRINHDFRRQGVPLSGMSLFRNLPKAWVLSLVVFWCLAHDLHYLKAANGVSTPCTQFRYRRMLVHHFGPDDLVGGGSLDCK